MDDPCNPDGGRCDECGSCINHDGCADSQHPLAEGDCPACGACAACIVACDAQAPWLDPEWQSNPYLWLNPPRPIVTVELPGVSR